jgi:formamidopyrimidine-DNA glycosylase
MTGQLLFESPETTPLKHTHVIFQLEGLSEELRYRDIRRFGYLEVIEKKDTKLGPDAWNSTDEEIYDALRQKLGMLKNALLNQNVLAGLGNIYVDESLFRTKLHPRKTLESLSAAKLKELCDSIRVVLGDSLNVGGTSFRNYVDTKGSRGGFKGRLKVYGKDGTPCSNCSTKIKKILVAGRGTHYCPKCQRAPRRSP